MISKQQLVDQNEILNYVDLNNKIKLFLLEICKNLANIYKIKLNAQPKLLAVQGKKPEIVYV